LSAGHHAGGTDQDIGVLIKIERAAYMRAKALPLRRVSGDG
jgi:hypothetical protein